VMCNKRKLYVSPEFKPGFMSKDIFERVLPWVSYATPTCWGGFGEPFLHPHYSEWAEDLKRVGATLECFTNGISLKRSLAEKLVDIQFDTITISIGGAREEAYKYIRGIKGLKSMLKNLASLNEVKRANNFIKPVVSFNLVAMNTVLPRLNDVIRLAHEYKVQSIIIPNLDVQYDENIKESIWTDIERAKDYIEEANHIAKEFGIGFCPPSLQEYHGDCRAFFTVMFVTYNGIILCCSTERYILGDLKTDPL
ncbi:MAG: radical SAM protein, partial [Desulfobacteraceae bacterium]|nr:radical SAM protein [Desulfobacteraceae bacterium]